MGWVMSDGRLPRHAAVTAVQLPPDSRLANAYRDPDLIDAFSVELPRAATTDPEVLARFVFSNVPAWSAGLMSIRDGFVAFFGLKTANDLNALSATDKASRISLFRIYSIHPDEIIFGEDDKHLDFRLSILCSREASSPGETRLTLSTVVKCHNRWGRMYLATIAPFHRLVARATLKRAAEIGFPEEPRALRRVNAGSGACR